MGGEGVIGCGLGSPVFGELIAGAALCIQMLALRVIRDLVPVALLIMLTAAVFASCTGPSAEPVEVGSCEFEDAADSALAFNRRFFVSVEGHGNDGVSERSEP